MPDSIKGDVETAAKVIVDSMEGFAGEVVLQIKYALGLLAVIEDMKKWLHSDGITAHLAGRFHRA